MQKLERSFYARDTMVVARELLGKYLVYVVNGQEKIGRIVETEAYLGAHDLACHASKGLTKRTRIMFGEAGFAYVYLIYGIYHCLNVVTEQPGHGAAVLLRALEPIKNIAERTNGPGLLCKAMQIDNQLNGEDLLSEHFYLASPEQDTEFSIITCPRIGVAYAKQWALEPLRFYIEQNPYVSRP